MKTIYSIYNILACLFIGLLFSCTNDEFEKEQAVDQSDLKVVVNATMVGYEGEDGQATKLTEGGTWQTGDVIYMCVGAEENSFTLTYQGGGQWKLAEWLGGNKNKAFAASSGKLTALYCSNAKNWRREGGKVTGETHGDIVYTKTGEYKLVNDVIYFNINLDTRPIAKLVIKDVAKTYFPTGTKVKGFRYLYGLFDLRWDNKGTTGTTYSYDSSTGTLTVWGVFGADDLEVSLLDLQSSESYYTYKRTYTGKKLQTGQTVTIKGPLGDEAGKWKKYDKNGNLVKTATIHYGVKEWRTVGGRKKSFIVMRGELPDNYNIAVGDSIFIRIVDQDGKALKLQGAGVSFSYGAAADTKVIHNTYNDTTAVLFANISGSEFLRATLPYDYPNDAVGRLNITRDQNKPILYQKLSDGTWKECGYRTVVNKSSTSVTYGTYKIMYKGKDVTPLIEGGALITIKNVEITSDKTNVVSVNDIGIGDSKTFKLFFYRYGTAKVTVKLLKETGTPEGEFFFRNGNVNHWFY